MDVFIVYVNESTFNGTKRHVWETSDTFPGY